MQFDIVLLSIFYNIFYDTFVHALTTFFSQSHKNKDILVYLMQSIYT